MGLEVVALAGCSQSDSLADGQAGAASSSGGDGGAAPDAGESPGTGAGGATGGSTNGTADGGTSNGAGGNAVNGGSAGADGGGSGDAGGGSGGNPSDERCAVAVELVSGPEGTAPSALFSAGDGTHFYFSVDDTYYYSDGTMDGTAQVPGLEGTPRIALPTGQVLFTTPSSVIASDGTGDGTVAIADIELEDFVVVDGLAYAVEADRTGDDSQLWVTDGTLAGTAPAFDLIAAADDRVLQIATDGTDLFFESDESYFLSDGTLMGTTQIDDLVVDRGNIHAAINGGVLVEDSALYFIHSSGSTTRISDGGILGIQAGCLAFGGYFYQTTFDLWTDGSGPATRLPSFGEDIGKCFEVAAGMIAIVGNVNAGNPDGLFVLSDLNSSIELYFRADAVGATLHRGDDLIVGMDVAETGVELYASDGSASGTHLIQDIAPGSASSSPQQLIAVGSDVYFTADDGAHGREIWKCSP